MKKMAIKGIILQLPPIMVNSQTKTRREMPKLRPIACKRPEPAPNLVVDKAPDLVGDKAPDIVGDKAPNLVRDKAPDLVGDKATNLVVDKVESLQSKKFTCDICAMSFYNQLMFNLHKQTHPENFNENPPSNHKQVGKFKCKKCNVQFSKLKILKKHEKTNCYENAEFKCSTCNYRFAARSYLRRHIKRNICSNTKDNTGNSEPAEKNVYKSKSRTCKLCDLTFETKKKLIEHQNKKECKPVKSLKESISCDNCFQKFPSEKELAKHLREEGACKNAVTRYECDVCHKRFSCKAGFENHMKLEEKRKKYIERRKKMRLEKAETLKVKKEEKKSRHHCEICQQDEFKLSTFHLLHLWKHLYQDNMKNLKIGCKACNVLVNASNQKEVFKHYNHGNNAHFFLTKDDKCKTFEFVDCGDNANTVKQEVLDIRDESDSEDPLASVDEVGKDDMITIVKNEVDYEMQHLADLDDQAIEDDCTKGTNDKQACFKEIDKKDNFLRIRNIDTMLIDRRKASVNHDVNEIQNEIEADMKNFIAINQSNNEHSDNEMIYENDLDYDTVTTANECLESNSNVAMHHSKDNNPILRTLLEIDYSNITVMDI